MEARLVATDEEIDRWVESRFTDPEKVRVARELARAMRDYGYTPWVMTGGGDPQVETEMSML